MKQRLSASCRELFSKHLAELHHEFFLRLDDELYALSEKAETSNLQAVYFEAMRAIRVEREHVEKNLLDVALKQFDDFWADESRKSKDTRKAEAEENQFTLIENEALEEALAVSTLIDKMNQVLRGELYGLDMRFAALLGQEEIDPESNPVGPISICHVFERMIKPLVLDFRAKLLIYKVYEKSASYKLGLAYSEMNSLLIKSGILPKLSRTYRKPASGAPTDGFSGPTHAEKDSAMPMPGAYRSGESAAQFGFDSTVDYQAFHELQSLLGEWRQRNGFLPLNTGGLYDQSPAFVHPTADVLNALSQLQTHTIAPVDRALPGLKFTVNDQLKSVSADNQKRSLASLDEDIIDMVGLVFDFILEDQNLPDAVKSLIGRLQIPVIKVAILEKGLFSRRSHPVRELLNKLAKAGSRLDGQTVAGNPLFTEIQSIVDKVLTEFDRNVALFPQLLERFDAFLEKNEQRTAVIENRTRQVTESKEQIELAKSKIGYALIYCMRGKEIPSFLRSFLNEAWKHVMLLAYLRKEKDPSDWERALLVVTRLIRSILPVHESTEKQNILKDIPELVKDIRKGLHNISFDAHKTSAFFKKLAVCQIQVMKASKQDTEPTDLPSIVCNPDVDAAYSALNSELATQLDEVTTKLTKVNEALFDDLGSQLEAGSVEPQNPGSIETSASLDEQCNDEFIEQADKLEVGQWMSLTDERQEILKAKLSWKSQVSSRYVFVNSKGAKIAEKTLSELAEDLRTGAASLIEDQNIRTMDKAVAAVMKTLKESRNESAAAV